MKPHEMRLRISSEEVSMERTLRPYALFALLQEAAIRHTEALGIGRDRTLDKGLLWVVSRQQVQIRRLPEYDEEIVLSTWPGQTMHVFFPRYFQMHTAGGEPLLTASALWMLLDGETRRFAFPEEHGIEIPGMDWDGQPPLPSAPALVSADREDTFTIPYSYVDINGHMNNARYLDLAEDLLPPCFHRKRLKEIRIAYLSEARYGQKLSVRFGGTDTLRCFCGTCEKLCFQLSLHYQAE
ncbi:MAG: thioesterase [Oscillospiraceae bacterium]|nr:thioesterase [Oscillospiraceae bacterium]